MLQYIGARYVPIFYQNSLDPTSSEWEANVTYEPMTWVSLPNGYMYISKKTVPANIGTPAQNGEYWLEAGQYNAYIQTLQDQIDDMNDGTVTGSLQYQINQMNDGSVPGSLQDQINDMNDGAQPGTLQAQINTNANDISTINGQITSINNTITDIEDDIGIITDVRNKRILVIGDSIGDTTIGYLQPNYITYLKPDLEDLGATFTNYSSSGRCISSEGPNNLTGAIANITGSYDYIILNLGINDYANQYTILSVKTALNNFRDWIISNQPNAKVFIVTMLQPATDYSNNHIPCDVYRNMLLNCATENRYGVIDLFGNSFVYRGSDAALRNRWTYNGDGVHPNTAFAPIYEKILLKFFLAGGSDVKTDTVTQFVSSSLAMGGQNLTIYFHGDGRIQIRHYLATYTPSIKAIHIGQFPDWLKSHFFTPFSVYTAEGGVQGLLRGDGEFYIVFPTAGVPYTDVSFNFEYTGYYSQFTTN